MKRMWGKVVRSMGEGYRRFRSSQVGGVTIEWVALALLLLALVGGAAAYFGKTKDDSKLGKSVESGISKLIESTTSGDSGTTTK